MPLFSSTLVGVLASWLIASSVWIYPHSLSYFNESIGGPLNGPKHLLGSNIDWGQDLLYLNSISEHEYSKPLHLAYVGSFGPQFAGFEECVPVETTNDDGPGALSNNESTLQAGLYAVSRNLIHGSGQSARDGRFGVVKYFSMFTAKQLLNRPSCEIDSAGYSIASFRLPNLGNGSDQPEQ